MNLKLKQVFPKSQMAINGILSEQENKQLNFRQQQFSIQGKNNNILRINFYEPDLQDVEWVLLIKMFSQSLQFIGIKSVSNSSLSFYKRKKLRIVLWKNDFLHFMGGEIRSKQNRGDLRKKIIESQKILPLKFKTSDKILFISQDLFPDQNIGVFLISTVQNSFYVLKANDHNIQLIDFNNQGNFLSLLTSMKGLLTSNTSQNQQNDKKIVSNILIKSIQNDRQSFKVFILKDFNLQIRFVNIPILPGDKSRNHIQLLVQMNLQFKIIGQILNARGFLLISSALYQLNLSDVASIFLIKNLQKINQFFLVSLILDLQKGQIISTNHLQLDPQYVQNIQFQKIPQTEMIILKMRLQSQILLLKIGIRKLQIIQNLKLDQVGNSILSKSFQNNKLILLTPFKIFDINMVNQDQEYIQRSKRIEMEEQNCFINDNFMEQLTKSIYNHKPIIKKLIKQNKLEQILKIIQSILIQIDLKLSSFQIKSFPNQTLIQLLRAYTRMSFCHIFISKQIQQDEILLRAYPKIKQKLQYVLMRNRTDSISQIFHILVKQEKWIQFLQIWIFFLQQYRQKHFFSNHKIREIQSYILNQYFTQQLNGFFYNYFGKPNLDNNLELEIQKLMLSLVKLSSGIISIYRQNYLSLIQKPLNLPVLKTYALQQLNSEIFYLIYFQTDQFGMIDLRSYLRNLRQHSDSMQVRNSIFSFVEQYMQSAKKGRKYPKPGTLSQITSVLKDNLQLIYDYLQTKDSDLSILIGMKLGWRQRMSQRILRTSRRIKTIKNKQKLLLTLPQKTIKEINQKNEWLTHLII